ncbi:MAG TPA: hypothetical protein VMK32_07850 [Burkholderiaceae bacterium]|nr:hypothetical protein [Burkholderiaceae bacterium]
MNTAIARISAFMIFSAAFAANAEYRCNPPMTVNDRLACEAAQQGPEALRRFVSRWDQQMASLFFADYVDDQTLKNWETRRMAAEQTKDETAPQVASNERH